MNPNDFLLMSTNYEIEILQTCFLIRIDLSKILLPIYVDIYCSASAIYYLGAVIRAVEIVNLC